MSKENINTNCLREDLKLWKKEVKATYQDIGDILKCSKSYVYEFMCRKKNVSYELGKNIETLVTLWSKDVFARYKVYKRLGVKDDK